MILNSKLLNSIVSVKVIFLTSPFKWHSTRMLQVQIKAFTNVFRIIFGLLGLSFKFSFKLQYSYLIWIKTCTQEGLPISIPFSRSEASQVLSHIHMCDNRCEKWIFFSTYTWPDTLTHTDAHVCLTHELKTRWQNHQICLSTHSQPGILIHIHVYMAYETTGITMTIAFFSTCNGRIFCFEMDLRDQIPKFLFWTVTTLYSLWYFFIAYLVIQCQ